jgi:hypothetical protein
VRERVIRLPAMSPTPVMLEVAIVEHAVPRWRRAIARTLLRLAARFARLRVRIVAADPDGEI